MKLPAAIPGPRLMARTVAVIVLLASGCTPEHDALERLSGTGPYLHNATDHTATVKVSKLGTVDLDCAAVAEDPGAYLNANAFRNPRNAVVDPGHNLVIDFDNQNGECAAILLETAGNAQVVFWMADELGSRSEPVVTPMTSDAAIVLDDGPNGLVASSPIDLVHDIKGIEPVAGERECAELPPGPLVQDQNAVNPIPQGWWYLADIGTNSDGCRRLDLARGSIDTEEQEITQWDVCVQDSDFVFEAGDALEFRGDTESLLITSIDAEDPPFSSPKAFFYSGRVDGPFSPLPEMTATSIDDGCVPQRIDGCNAIRTPMALQILLEPDVVLATLTPEQPATTHRDAQDIEWRIRMERNSSYPIRDRDCAQWQHDEARVRVFITGRA